MEFHEFDNLLRALMPFDSGNMFRNGLDTIETPNQYIGIYQDSRVEYITYQEEGFRHWISGKMVTKNQGFISQKTTGMLNRISWSETLGLPYSIEAQTDEALKRNNSILINSGMVAK